MRSSVRVVVGFVCLLLAPQLVYAQASITGVVRDTSGAVLPGVTVEAASPALIEKVRVSVSDGGGQYRIENLRPGAYTVTFTLPGFRTVRREGIELSGSFVATVNAELPVGSLEESITVTGETPIVDVQSAGQQNVLSQEVLDTMPVNRTPAFLAAMLPAVTNSAVDVGGNIGAPVTGGGALSVHGSRTTDLFMAVSGVSVQTLETGSNTQGIPNVALASEIVIDTATTSAERTTAGVHINMIPREGGNTFSGDVRFAYGNESLQGNNITQDLRDRGLRTPNSVKKMMDFNPAFGGPIKRDRLWFFGTALVNHTDNWIAGGFYNANAGDYSVWTYEPDLGRQTFSNNKTWNAAGRLTWQVNPTHKLAFAIENTSTCQCAGAPPAAVSATRTPEASVPSHYNPNMGSSVEWTAPFTSRLLLEGVVYPRVIKTLRYHPLDLSGAVGPEMVVDPAAIIAANQAAYAEGRIGVVDQASGITYRAVPDLQIRNRSAVYPHRLTLSYITGAHSFKVGYSNIVGAKKNFRMHLDAPISYRFNNGVPNQLTLNATPYDAEAKQNADLGLFVQDRWTVNRLTLDLGVRYEHLRTSYPDQYAGPGLFVPDRDLRVPAADGLSWHDLSPRAGVAFDVFGTGRTAVKLSAGRFVSGQALRGSGDTLVFGDSLNPIEYIVNTTNRSWRDSNGNFVPDCDLLAPNANGECGAMSNRDFGTTRPGATYDPDVLRGWFKRAYNWHFSAGIQHQLLPRTSVEVAYFRRVYGNFAVTDDRALGAEDFDQFSIVAPAHADLAGGGGYVIDGLYNIKPGRFGTPSDNYITSAANYGKETEHWNGFDVNAVARPFPAVVLQGGISTGRTTANSCEIQAALPEMNPLNPYCDTTQDFLTQVKLLGSYTIPRVDVQISGTLQNVPGPELVGNFTATNAVVAPSLGRNLSGGAANVSVRLVEPGTMYGERRNQLDLRFGKILQAAGLRTTATIDVYNVFNANPVLTENAAFAQFRRPTGILPPRMLKFTVQLSF